MSQVHEMFQRVGVVGVGRMGAGIAYLLAFRGIDVVGTDSSQPQIDAARNQIQTFAEDAVAKGKLEAAEISVLHDRITLGTELAAMRGCDLVIEAVPEDQALKIQILSALAAVVAPGAVVSSNTSSVSVTELATAVPHPERFLGVHFFNPVPSMRLVEVIAHPLTAPEVRDRVVAFMAQLDREVLAVPDRPGFLVNSVLIPYINQAVAELDGHLGTPAAIDEAVRLGLGYPVGPYEMLEIIGANTHLGMAELVYEQTHLPEMAPPPLLRRLTAERRLRQLDLTSTGE